MDTTEREQVRQWVTNWREVGQRLAELRRQELPAIDTQQALLNLADAFESCRLHHAPRPHIRLDPTTGLVQTATAMIEIFRLAAELELLCTRQNWPFCFIGGIAVQRWGEPRVTQDVDLTVWTGFGDESHVIDGMLSNFSARIADAADFASRHRVLLLKSESGIGIDVSLGGLPYEQSMLQRASPFEFLPGLELLTCSAEDLIVLKAFADRPRDWVDVEGVISRQRSNVDWSYVVQSLTPLAEVKESPQILDRLDGLRLAAE